MHIILLIAVFLAHFMGAEKAPEFEIGIKQSDGSRLCPSGYVPVQSVEECKQVAEGPCLSSGSAECGLWSKYVDGTFAKDRGVSNQPGCYYDEDNGVWFNTNTDWSGTHNEKDDRPICKQHDVTYPADLYSDGVKQSDGSRLCPSGYAPVNSVEECQLVAEGPCLSSSPAECDLWSKWLYSDFFAKDRADDNQPGCYYDEGHGVLFNKRTDWSGKHSEKDDRPICKKHDITYPADLYTDGITKSGGSRLCPSGYAPVNSEEECQQVAEGPCLSSNENECLLWAKRLYSDLFAKDFGRENQPGCAYDEGHGVVFNTNTDWSGTFNEDDDRPICKHRPSKFGYVTSGTCEDVGMHSIFSDEECKAAVADLSITDPHDIFSYKNGKAQWNYDRVTGDHGSDRPTGCSFKNIDETTNVELSEQSSGKCDVNGSHGCFCLRDDFYVDGVRKPNGSDSCPIYYVPIDNVEECKKVAEGPCLSNYTEECELWSKWVNTDSFAKDHGEANQPGCYYDEDHGVFFNTRTDWSGTFNEPNDRPLCKKNSETFSESKIVRMLRELKADAREEINLIENDVSESKETLRLARLDLEAAREEEGRLKVIWDEAKTSEGIALGKLEAAEKELEDSTPGLEKEMEIFETILTKLDSLLNGTELLEKNKFQLNVTELFEKNKVQLDPASTAFISSMQQADPVRIQKVSDMIKGLIKDANTTLNDLHHEVAAAKKNHEDAVHATSEAYGNWLAAHNKVQSEIANVSELEAILSEREKHAEVRIPALEGKIEDIEEAIVLIKSLEE